MEHAIARTALAVIGALSLLAGCGHGDATTTPQTTGPLVSYQRSGGIAGVLDELRVGGDGDAVLVTGQERTRTAFTVDPAELKRLRFELESADLSDPPGPPGDPGCADCFAYRVEYGDREVTFTEVDEPSQSLADLVAHLDAIVAAHASQP